MSDYLAHLNPSQRKAVEQTQGPLMVIAGAGSGKTSVLTYRIAHLLKKGVDSDDSKALLRRVINEMSLDTDIYKVNIVASGIPLLKTI